MKIVISIILLAWALGKMGLLPSATESMMWLAVKTHQQGPMSYSKFNRKLWSGSGKVMKVQKTEHPR